MSNTRPHRADQSTVALVALLTFVLLVLVSPLGWLYILPAIGDSLVAVWTLLATTWTVIFDGAMTAIDGMTGILAG